MLTAGETVSHYRILEKVGAGGMGVVYRAHDERLDRDVALKVLPPECVADPNRKRRFVQEARAASALNHPNIITIYDIDEVEGVHLIAMEYIDGKTLDRLISHHGLPLDKALKYAVEMAAALTKAHSAGIVHRDLKPTNIMVNGEGLVKVLDFGLAKLTEAAPTGDAETIATTEPRTEEGTVVGTVGYMSPEQAEGKPVDARSDIFSFGSVLYEMLAGQRAFQGETKVSTLAAILREEPKSLSEVASSIPHEVERIIKRCLRKDREHRFQHMDDLKVALEELKAESDSGELTKQEEAAPPVPTRLGQSKAFPHRLSAIVGIAVMVLAGVGVWLLTRTPPPPKVLGIRQITRTGQRKSGKIATDGARLYFADQVGGRPVLMAVPAAGGDAVPISTPLENAFVEGMTPDGSELIVGSYVEVGEQFTVWRVPVLGGSARRIGNLVVDGATVTPDGQSLIYTSGGDAFIAKMDGTASRKLFSFTQALFGPVCSPDSKTVRFVTFRQGTRSGWETSLNGKNFRPFLPDWNPGGSKCCGSWTADNKYYVFEASPGDGTNLWVLREGDIFGGGVHDPVPLTTGPMQYGGFPAITSDGRKIFTIGILSRAELSVYDSRLGQFVPYLGGIPAEGLDFSRDGQWLTYVRLPEGTLWRMRKDGSDLVQLTFPPMKVYNPRWSPDGKRIAFADVPPDGHSKIYVIPAAGGVAEALTSGENNEFDATWSPDGNALMFDYGSNSPESSVQVMNLSSRGITEIPGSKGIFSARWSPDGSYAAALKSSDYNLMLFDFKSQRWDTLTTFGAAFENWTQDGKYINFVDNSSGIFKRINIATRKIEEVARLGNARLLNGVPGYPWRGYTPEGAPLIARDGGTQEIYALDVDFP